MKKIGRILLGIIIVDYFRVCFNQLYCWKKRMDQGNDFWDAWRKVGPDWRDKVIFYETLEEEV